MAARRAGVHRDAPQPPKETRLKTTWKTLARVATVAALVALPGLAQAQDSWPTKPVSLVVPYPPGGTSDVIGRQLAQRLR